MSNAVTIKTPRELQIRYGIKVGEVVRKNLEKKGKARRS